MKISMLRSAIFLVALSTSFAGELSQTAVWQATGNSFYTSSSSQLGQTAAFPWMSEQVTTQNNRWSLPESSSRAYAGGTGVSTADAMFSSYWVGETPVSTYVNNTPFPSSSLGSSGSGLAVFGGTSSYSNTASTASTVSSVSSSVPSNVAASTYNFGSTSTITSYGTSSSASSSASSSGLMVFGGTDNPYAVNAPAPVRRFDFGGNVPEPQTYAMIGTGLVVLAALRRRRVL